MLNKCDFRCVLKVENVPDRRRSTGSVIAWVSEIRYLGVYFSRFSRFKCSIDHAKRSFYKAANSVFGKIGRIASEEVGVQTKGHKTEGH